MRLSILRERLAVCRLAPDASFPAWATGDGFWSVTRTANELSVICDEGRIPVEVRCEKGWRALMLHGPFGFDEVGVLLPIVATLARADIGILPVATFDTDYVLLKEDHLPLARKQLEAAGYRLSDA
jgi:hypothetical protein